MLKEKVHSCILKIHQFIVIEICSDRSQHNDRESISLLRHRSFPSCLRFPFILWIIVQWGFTPDCTVAELTFSFIPRLFVKLGEKRNFVYVEKFELAFSFSWSLRKCDWTRLGSEKIQNNKETRKNYLKVLRSGSVNPLLKTVSN